jgi:hypothetical protein
VGALWYFESMQQLSFAPILPFPRRTGEGTLPDSDGLSKRHKLQAIRSNEDLINFVSVISTEGKNPASARCAKRSREERFLPSVEMTIE